MRLLAGLFLALLLAAPSAAERPATQAILIYSGTTGYEFLSLATALLRLEQGAEQIPMKVNQATECMYIVKPLSGGGRGCSKAPRGRDFPVA